MNDIQILNASNNIFDQYVSELSKQGEKPQILAEGKIRSAAMRVLLREGKTQRALQSFEASLKEKNFSQEERSLLLDAFSEVVLGTPREAESSAAIVPYNQSNKVEVPQEAQANDLATAGEYYSLNQAKGDLNKLKEMDRRSVRDVALSRDFRRDLITNELVAKGKLEEFVYGIFEASMDSAGKIPDGRFFFLDASGKKEGGGQLALEGAPHPAALGSTSSDPYMIAYYKKGEMKSNPRGLATPYNEGFVYVEKVEASLIDNEWTTIAEAFELNPADHIRSNVKESKRTYDSEYAVIPKPIVKEILDRNDIYFRLENKVLAEKVLLDSETGTYLIRPSATMWNLRSSKKQPIAITISYVDKDVSGRKIVNHIRFNLKKGTYGSPCWVDSNGLEFRNIGRVIDQNKWTFQQPVSKEKVASVLALEGGAKEPVYLSAEAEGARSQMIQQRKAGSYLMYPGTQEGSWNVTCIGNDLKVYDLNFVPRTVFGGETKLCLGNAALSSREEIPLFLSSKGLNPTPYLKASSIDDCPARKLLEDYAAGGGQKKLM